jgi:hypothetical protein
MKNPQGKDLPRISVEITKEQNKGLSRLPHGVKTKVFRWFTDELNKLISEDTEKIATLIAAIELGLLKLSDLIERKKDESRIT